MRMLTFLTDANQNTKPLPKLKVVMKSSWIEKSFWYFCIMVSLIFSWLLIKKAQDAFETNAISFVMESSYRDWDTDFPAIIICESKNLQSIERVADKIWGVNHDVRLDDVLSEIAFFSGESYYTIRTCGTTNPMKNCLQSNFTFYAKLVRNNCTQLITNCMWNSQSFDCCKYFSILETEKGDCYAINSLHARHPNLKELNMISNRENGLGILKFDLKHEADVFILGSEEVPALTTPKSSFLSVGPSIRYIRHIAKHDIENDANIQSTSLQQRSCLFNYENVLDVYKYYSYSACTVQCRKERQLDFCNCSGHFTPNTENWKKCDVKGLECLNKNRGKIFSVSKIKTPKKDDICECLPSCTESDITTIYNYKENLLENSTTSSVEISLIELPTERFQRKVIRRTLDLIVSFGGITGLLVGASIINFIELIYYITLRRYCSKRQI